MEAVEPCETQRPVRRPKLVCRATHGALELNSWGVEPEALKNVHKCDVEVEVVVQAAEYGRGYRAVFVPFDFFGVGHCPVLVFPLRGAAVCAADYLSGPAAFDFVGEFAFAEFKFFFGAGGKCKECR